MLKKDGTLRKKIKEQIIKEVSEIIIQETKDSLYHYVKNVINVHLESDIPTFPKILEETMRLQALANQNSIQNGKHWDGLSKQFQDILTRLNKLEKK